MKSYCNIITTENKEFKYLLYEYYSNFYNKFFKMTQTFATM